jgi:hypothetical protein
MGAGVGMPWIKRTVAGAAEMMASALPGWEGMVQGLGRVRGDGEGVRSTEVGGGECVRQHRHRAVLQRDPGRRVSREVEGGVGVGGVATTQHGTYATQSVREVSVCECL